MFDAVRDLSESITLKSTRDNATFPYVTVDYFESRARHAREQSGFDSLFWMPLVEEYQVPEWLEYSQINAVQWIRDSRDIALATEQAHITKDSGLVLNGEANENYRDTPVPAVIYNATEYVETGVHRQVTYQGPYLPKWQLSPPPLTMDPVNVEFMMHEYMKDAYQAVSVAREGIFTKFVQFSDQTGEAPESALIQPIFERLNDPDSRLVGLMHGRVSWDKYLIGLLPEGVSGMYCVLKNSCGGAYTYKLDGRKAIFLGQGDYHEQEYDGTEYIIQLDDYLFPNVTTNTPGHCMYSFITYSSTEYRESTMSNIPVMFTVAVGTIFLLVVIVFVVYDKFVNDRNAKVLNAAARANSILSSLFPKDVRERLVKEKEDQLAAKKLKNSGAAPKSHLNAFLANGEKAADPVDDDGDIVQHIGKPIADLYTDTTVLVSSLCFFKILNHTTLAAICSHPTSPICSILPPI